MEPQTGHVKAWVGGTNYRHFQYDMVKQGKRQVGSTFKPFVYATAMDQLHLSPCYELSDSPFCIEKGKYGNMEAWCPKNSGDEYIGMRTLTNAMANSVNTVTATAAIVTPTLNKSSPTLPSSHPKLSAIRSLFFS